jgi:hypothetical protein
MDLTDDIEDMDAAFFQVWGDRVLAFVKKETAEEKQIDTEDARKTVANDSGASRTPSRIKRPARCKYANGTLSCQSTTIPLTAKLRTTTLFKAGLSGDLRAAQLSPGY